jgi:hypothetical protein
MFLMFLIFLKGRYIINAAFECHIMPVIAFFSLHAFAGQWFWGHCPEKAQVVK